MKREEPKRRTLNEERGPQAEPKRRRSPKAEPKTGGGPQKKDPK